MGRSFWIVAGISAVLLASTGPVRAFQQEPVAPIQPAPPGAKSKPSAKPAAIVPVPPPTDNLTTPSSPAQAASSGGSFEIFNYGVLPKLDFGLDVLFGKPGDALQDSPASGLDNDSDIGVLGKMKRSF
jgi:hypothetical protein